MEQFLERFFECINYTWWQIMPMVFLIILLVWGCAFIYFRIKGNEAEDMEKLEK